MSRRSVPGAGREDLCTDSVDGGVVVVLDYRVCAPEAFSANLGRVRRRGGVLVFRGRNTFSPTGPPTLGPCG